MSTEYQLLSAKKNNSNGLCHLPVSGKNIGILIFIFSITTGIHVICFTKYGYLTIFWKVTKVWNNLIIIESHGTDNNTHVFTTANSSFIDVDSVLSNSTLNKTYLISWYNTPDFLLIDQRTTNLENCEFKNCFITTNRSLDEMSDILLFYDSTLPSIPPENMKPIWVFVTYESPYHVQRYNAPNWQNTFDWTMTYRKDSEGFSPYDVIVRRDTVPDKNYSDIFRTKTKNIAWIVSNCNTVSKRMNYVKEMQKVINVDIFGACGNFKCKGNGLECRRHLAKDYKFYLAFENSLCNDYITEKLFQIYLNVDMVPIIRGAPNIKDHVPNGTYISTSDFKSPNSLAMFLKQLSSDENRYISYLQEKNKYIVKMNGYIDLDLGYCNLCKRLNNFGSKKGAKLNLSNWIWTNQCHAPSDI